MPTTSTHPPATEVDVVDLRSLSIGSTVTLMGSQDGKDAFGTTLVVAGNTLRAKHLGEEETRTEVVFLKSHMLEKAVTVPRYLSTSKGWWARPINENGHNNHRAPSRIMVTKQTDTQPAFHTQEIQPGTFLRVDTLAEQLKIYSNGAGRSDVLIMSRSIVPRSFQHPWPVTIGQPVALPGVGETQPVLRYDLLDIL